MSGKGKGKGKAKEKSKKKDKIKPNEIKLFDGCISLERFAYDVITYTALKFNVPESCIAVWKDKCNDYGCDDFLLVACINILGTQIVFRHLYHAYFSKHYEEYKLATPDSISTLLFKVIKEITREFQISPLKIVERSLSAACELFLFLYSKDMDLNPRKLAKTWYECYLNTHKKDFEAVGGIQEMYVGSYCSKCDVVDAFLNKFIEAHCLPYQTTASNPDLKKLFLSSGFEALKAHISLSRRDTEEERKELKRLCAVFNRLASLEFDVELSAPDGATGFNQPESTGTPMYQVSQFSGSSAATASQEVPATIPEIQPWFQRDLTIEERKEKLASKCPIDKDTRKLVLDSLETKQSTGSSDLQTVPFKISFNRSDYDFSWLRTSDQKPGVSTATVTTQSNVHQGAEFKDRIQNTGSSDFSDILPPFEKGIRQLTFRGWEKQSSDQKPGVSTATVKAQSNEHQGAQLNGRAQNTGSSDLQTGESNGTNGDKTVE